MPDVLIIGAGPAGSSAAIALARAGFDVSLVDRAAFPRDKVCGDALIPDALRALARLSVDAEVRREARLLGRMRIFSPNRTPVEIEGEFACLPRRTLDAILQRKAVTAAAAFHAPWRLAAPLERHGVVAGARFVSPGGGELALEAGVTLLATGAAATPLELFGGCPRRSPSALALRAYYRLPDELAAANDRLIISYDREICPGYGWIFPGPGGVVNLGVGLFRDTRRRPATENLRELWERFVRGFEPAGVIAENGTPLGPIAGAPLRTAMSGARFERPGLLVVGEAAGMTYSFSGAGIGKAMESALLAAETIVDGWGGRDVAAIGSAYASTIRRRYADRFPAYQVAQSWLAHPRLCDLVAWRANAGRYVRRQFEGLIVESTDPRSVFSLIGMIRTIFG